MFITIAGVRKEITDGISVTELIKREDIESPEYVSVSVNDDFIKRENFDTTALQEGDAVEFLYFMGGGEVTAKQQLQTYGIYERAAGTLFQTYYIKGSRGQGSEEIIKQ